MSTDVLAVGPDVQGRRQPSVAVLGRTEAMRILTSPATRIAAGYLVALTGVETLSRDGGGIFLRAALAEMLATFCIFLFGPITFVASHLTATSARRTGSEGLLAAAPVDQRRRDLGLCVGVLAGPAALSLALALLSALLAGNGVLVPGIDWVWTIGPWSWSDVLQVPAIVLGAGILGIVVARWVSIPGALIAGFAVMVVGTGWLQAGGGEQALRPWFAPWVAITWWSDDGWRFAGSQAWHVAYLLSLSGLGVCVVALRQRERRAAWLVAGSLAALAVVGTGLLQLP